MGKMKAMLIEAEDKEFQKLYAIYEHVAMDYMEPGTKEETLFVGLSAEVGEVAQERMKELRKKVDRSDQILDELSDVLWFICAIAEGREANLATLMKMNLNKLERRAKNGK